MEERLRFVARLLDGEAMTDVCRDIGISHKTGNKIFEVRQGLQAAHIVVVLGIGNFSPSLWRGPYVDEASDGPRACRQRGEL